MFQLSFKTLASITCLCCFSSPPSLNVMYLLVYFCIHMTARVFNIALQHLDFCIVLHLRLYHLGSEIEFFLWGPPNIIGLNCFLQESEIDMSHCQVYENDIIWDLQLVNQWHLKQQQPTNKTVLTLPFCIQQNYTVNQNCIDPVLSLLQSHIRCSEKEQVLPVRLPQKSM